MLICGWILEEYQREGRNREVEVGQVVRRGWLLRLVGGVEGGKKPVSRAPASLYGSAHSRYEEEDII